MSIPTHRDLKTTSPVMTLSVKSRGTDGMLGDMGPSPVIGLGVRWEFSELVTQETKKSGRI